MIEIAAVGAGLKSSTADGKKQQILLQMKDRISYYY
jgi:hypothetical protein